VRTDDHHLSRVLRSADLGNRVPLGDRVGRHGVVDVHLQLDGRAGAQQSIEHGVLLVRDHDLRQREDAVGRAAHVEQVLLFPGLEHDAERSRVAKQERRERPPT